MPGPMPVNMLARAKAMLAELRNTERDEAEAGLAHARELDAEEVGRRADARAAERAASEATPAADDARPGTPER